MSLSFFSSPVPILLLFLSFTLATAIVPPSKTFKYINEGEFASGFYKPNEYNANYRYTNIGQNNLLFHLCFYSTTPNAFTLGLRMGYQPSDNPANFRWIWDANRGKPVRENATLTFSSDGNLVLADVDGKIAWQTGTANKGVVDLELLDNGNLVLRDNKGKLVWQSFNYPTDTLLIGQALRRGGPMKLVSRVSNVDGSEGIYSLVMEKTRLAMYMKSKNSAKPLLYYTNGQNPIGSATTQSVVFNIAPETVAASAYQLRYEFLDEQNTTNLPWYYWTMLLARTKYNATFSFVRLESDGDLKTYTFYTGVEWGYWEITSTLFSNNVYGENSLCKLPKKCGSLGLCDKGQCVACPRPKGLKGWSESCQPPRLPVCKNGNSNVDYYKVVGVEHFTSEYNEGEGPIDVTNCKAKCNKDCGCLGVFYKEESSKCFLAPELGTLSKVSNHSHVAYIKTPIYAKVAL